MPTMPMRVDPYAKAHLRPSTQSRAFALVLLLHIGFFVLLQSLTHLTPPIAPQSKLVEVISAQLIAAFREPEPTPTSPKVQPPQIKQSPAPQPAPVLTSQSPPPASAIPSALPAITAPPSSPVPISTPPVASSPVAAPAPTRAPVITAPVAVTSSCEKPRYPPISERLQEEGVVSLRFLISENGQVVSGMVEKSSGYKRLDDAALAALSLCKFKPATVDGKPKQEWSSLRYRWEIKE
jgi:periplasmic protein TonB